MQASAQEFLAPPRPMQPDIRSREHHKHSLAAVVLRTAGTLRLAARGYSMLPTLWPGDVLTVEAQSSDRVQVGDVALFARRTFLYSSSCAQGCGSAWRSPSVARGDAMTEEDDPILPEELLGKVVAIEHGAGKVAVPACSGLRRQVGLLLSHSARLRSLALRWHAWRFQSRNPNPDLSAQEVSLG